LARNHGRGFSERNLDLMRGFYLGWEISQTLSAKFEAHVRLPPDVSSVDPPGPATTGPSSLVPSSGRGPDVTPVLTEVFPLPWSHYVRLLSVANPYARAFYESEAIRGGWSVRQL